MKVLSLFDGISCGQIAFERTGIKVDKYYASEIDKYAIQITQNNYPDTIQLGSITDWQSWNIENPDIIIAGSPCQGFSFAGKQLNFSDPRSALFFTFIEILKHYKPKYFLLENVIMKAEYNDVISSILGEIYPECVTQKEMFRSGRLEPIEINSALLSAQNRRRLYWTNIQGITQPKDKGILLKDIIETGITEKDKSYCIDANYAKGGNEKNYIDKSRRQLIITGGRMTGRNPDNPKSRKSGLPTVQMLEIKEDGKSNCISTVGKDSLCVCIGSADVKGFDCQKRVYSTEGNSPSIVSQGHQPKISDDNITWRKLTVTECERLQTVKDGYCKSVSKSRAYHALGNGWTVDVIAHIFSFIKKSDQNNQSHKRLSCQ